ncbi:MAG TPA: hypothetical protein VJK72_02035 [Candidatus Nanoarchaeia archaeon]|nr:hypothetical protein [Candidatus Nanoarchaeia archaeon]
MKMHIAKKPSEIEIKDWIDEEDFYSEDARILLIEDDELSGEEEGFMQGYGAV